MSTELRIRVSVIAEGKTKSLEVAEVLDEQLPEAVQRTRVKGLLWWVRRSVVSCLLTAAGHDVFGWDAPELGELLKALVAGGGEPPDLGEMVRLRYPGYDKEARDGEA